MIFDLKINVRFLLVKLFNSLEVSCVIEWIADYGDRRASKQASIEKSLVTEISALFAESYGTGTEIQATHGIN